MRYVIWIAVVGSLTGCPDDGGDETTAAETMTAETTAGPSGTTAGATAASSGEPESSTSAAGSGTSTGSLDTSTGGATTGAAAPTWNGFAMGFFETYCWECHGPGDALRDYSMLSAVMAESNTIRCGTAPVGSMLADCAGEPPASQFPIGANLPTDDERAMLVEWIEAGLPEG